MTKYFDKINSYEELKNTYKALLKEHHPDNGGDVEIMQEINIQYDVAFALWKNRKEIQTGEEIKETAESTRREFYTQYGWEGSRYDGALKLKEIAKTVRAYVKEKYPTYKFSVRTSYASMCQELHVDLKESPIEVYKKFEELTEQDTKDLIRKAEANDYFTLNSWNDAELKVELERIWQEHGNFYKCINDVTRSVIDDVDAFVNSYNYDDSDSMIDYFDTNFYYLGCAQNNGMNIKVVPKTARIKNAENTPAKARKKEKQNRQPQKEPERKIGGQRYRIEESRHTKTNEKIWLVKLNDKLDREQFLQEKEKMKELGGYYSRYTHSFVFDHNPEKELNNTVWSRLEYYTMYLDGNIFGDNTESRYSNLEEAVNAYIESDSGAKKIGISIDGKDVGIAYFDNINNVNRVMDKSYVQRGFYKVTPEELNDILEHKARIDELLHEDNIKREQMTGMHSEQGDKITPEEQKLLEMELEDLKDIDLNKFINSKPEDLKDISKVLDMQVKTEEKTKKTVVAIESTDDYIDYEWGFNPVDGRPKYRLVQVSEEGRGLIGYPGDMFLDFNSMSDLRRYVERESDKIEVISYDEIITRSLISKKDEEPDRTEINMIQEKEKYLAQEEESFTELSKYPAVILPNGWEWNIYADGSGSLHSPSGERYFSFDSDTREIMNLDERYIELDGDMKNQNVRVRYENILANYMNEHEQQIKNIPDDVTILFGRDKRTFDTVKTEQVALSEDIFMNGKAFNEWYRKARNAEEKNFSDYTTSPIEFARKVTAVVRSGKQNLEFEGEKFDIKDAIENGNIQYSGYMMQFVRISEEPVLSFDEWMDKKGYDKSMLASDITYAEFLGGLSTVTTQRAQNVQRGNVKRIAYSREKHAEYKDELNKGIIAKVWVRSKLDLSKEADRAYCRMQIKKLESRGETEKAKQWQEFYEKNAVKYESKNDSRDYKNAITKYFDNINSYEELKNTYKALLKEHHPDNGGDVETMKKINMEYDVLFDVWKHKQEEYTGEEIHETAESTRRRFYTQNGWIGSNYDSSLTLEEIAKIVGTYVKEKYPTYKFSVQTFYAITGEELYVELKESPIEVYKKFEELTEQDKKDLIRKAEANNYFTLNSWNDAELKVELERIWQEYGNFYKCLNNDMRAVVDDVDTFVKSYVKTYDYDDSGNIIDYSDANYDTNFYYFGCAQNNGTNIKVVQKTAGIKNEEKAVEPVQKKEQPDRTQIDMIQDIAQAERMLSIPENERITEWFGDYAIYEAKPDVSSEQIKAKYREYEPLVPFPDTTISIAEMHDYGYTWNGMLPISKERAKNLNRNFQIFKLYEDGTEALATDETELDEHQGMFGITVEDWQAEKEKYLAEQKQDKPERDMVKEPKEKSPLQFVLEQMSEEEKEEHIQKIEGAKDYGDADMLLEDEVKLYEMIIEERDREQQKEAVISVEKEERQKTEAVQERRVPMDIKITDMYIDKNDSEHIDKGGRLATVTLLIDDLFVVHGVNLMRGKNGMFVAMPSIKNSNGEYQNYAYFNDSKDREDITMMVMREYIKKMGREEPETKHISVNMFLEEKGNQKAYCTVVIDGRMNINRIRVMEGKNGLFVSMPKIKDREGKFHDVISPASAEAYTAITDLVMKEYIKQSRQKARQETSPDIQKGRGKLNEARR